MTGSSWKSFWLAFRSDGVLYCFFLFRVNWFGARFSPFYILLLPVRATKCDREII